MVFQKRSFALSTTATIEFCYLLFVAANYYFNIALIVPRFLYKQRYIDYVFLFIAGVVVTAFIRVPLAAYLNANYFFPDLEILIIIGHMVKLKHKQFFIKNHSK